MALATLETVVGDLTSTVGYLRVSVDAAGDDWLPCTALSTEPRSLAAAVDTTKRARGVARDDVAMSLFVQAYAFRVATVVIGAWLLDDVLVDGGPDGWSIALGRGRPNSVRLAGDLPVAAAGGAGDINQALVDGHLSLLVGAAHEACRVGRALLWGNVAASCAAAFSAFASARSGVADRAGSFFDAARPEVSAAGRLARAGERFAWERRSCCLWYQADGGFMCEDCSLRPADEHAARVAAMGEVQG